MSSVGTPENNDGTEALNGENNVMTFPKAGDTESEQTADDVMDDDFRLMICLSGENTKKLSAEKLNSIYDGIGQIADSDDLYDTQSAIYNVEVGFAALYRTLDRIINLGNMIESSADKDIDAAFKKLHKAIKDGNGFKGIGRPKRLFAVSRG